ncbi:hypothetical protein COX69_04515 [Candidatus Falkowbacteria bacterium CG_4_10_14_0_2_um_filter_48_10]|uniref:Uncharacterized protein n=1 Tax=Candidatus Falkowbacteria bacterium CG23_combo_of_CG06-09_8_20_14_all_49_15 TaxID=1974572 RepID=A0A2G9ZL39_9BACT|nr:MAG: hypothetical protein COX22_02025 [Candidatus Falkowbacteria bacterium CG23_combo_of_CG06-09_8_20_14_all_49_15]PJA07521.1 MAG: hypothetical protein COX69_04515 [Candidatus Falkowbacteria bacterium CG_4_10_14_0_2_um_filter_48_10]
MKKISHVLLVAVAIFALLMPMLVMVASVNAQTANLGLNYAQNVGLPTSNQDPREMAVNIIKFFLTFLGIIAVAVILYGGFVWLTAGGNDDRVGKAKKLIVAGIIGLIIVISAFAIVQWIITSTFNLVNTGTI